MGRYPLRTEIKRYLTEMKDYYAPRTLRVKRIVLDKVADIFDEQCRNDSTLVRNPSKWTEREVVAVATALRDRGVARNTLTLEVSILRSFLEYLGNGVMSRMKARTPSFFPRATLDRKPSLTEKQLSDVLAAIETEKGWKGECMRFMFWTYAYTGLRESELRNASKDDLNIADWTLRVRHPKGERTFGESRTVPIPDPLRPKVLRFLEARSQLLSDIGKLESPYLVFSRQNPDTPISEPAVQGWKREVAARSGVSFTIHTLRRTYGQMLLDRGVPLETVSLALGHASTVTTEKHYCRKDAGVARLEIANALAKPAMPPVPQSPVIEKNLPLPGYA